MTLLPAERAALHNPVQVLDKGFVRLDDYMASDSGVVNAARVLVEKTVGEMGDRDERLLKSMMEGRHGTPFEHNSFRWHIKVPIFVVREWQRHRIGSYNEMSLRWMTAEPDFYEPLPEDVRAVEEGAMKIEYRYESVTAQQQEAYSEDLADFHKLAYRRYKFNLDLGIAPEQARYFIPNTFFTQMIWTVNARSLMNFLSLRNERHAMWEIRQYAMVVEDIFSKVMPVTWQAFNENGRKAP